MALDGNMGIEVYHVTVRVTEKTAVGGSPKKSTSRWT